MIFTEHLGSLSIIRPSLVWNRRTELKTDIKVVEFLAKLLDIDLNCQDKQVSISTPTIIWTTPSQASSSNSTTSSSFKFVAIVLTKRENCFTLGPEKSLALLSENKFCSVQKSTPLHIAATYGHKEVICKTTQELKMLPLITIYR